MIRLTDPDKWKQTWFRKLPGKMKLAWVYITDQCNDAGVFEGDFDLMSFLVGDTITEDECVSYFGPSRFIPAPFGENKYLVKKFIEFQYSSLTETNPVHRAILKKIAKTLRVTGPELDQLRSTHDPHEEKREEENRIEEKRREKKKEEEKEEDAPFYRDSNGHAYARRAKK